MYSNFILILLSMTLFVCSLYIPESCPPDELPVKDGCKEVRTCNRCTICSHCICDHGFIRTIPGGECILIRECYKERATLQVEETAANSLGTHIADVDLLVCNNTDEAKLE